MSRMSQDFQKQKRVPASYSRPQRREAVPVQFVFLSLQAKEPSQGSLPYSRKESPGNKDDKVIGMGDTYLFWAFFTIRSLRIVSKYLSKK
mmetsp:Transcript_19607/g.37970  ORF Transcript_19607/g.37970 Transcript_19607/m.37970 type:complete len:90 (-) Transcript_19607:423-692(-)